MAASRLVIVPPAALLLGIALVAWAWWQPTTATEPSGHTAAVLAPPEPPPAAEPEPARAEPPAAARPAASRLAPLLTAPEAELRATLHAALSARAEGGRLYARALARRCADLAALPPPAQAPDINDARHQRAVARGAALTAGCRQFANAEWLALVNIATDEPVNDDPLLAIQQSALDDAALLQAVFARPDPLLLDELGERLLQRRIDGQPMLYFDGQRFADEAGIATAQAALRLLPCHFGLTCDERDPEVWLACLRGDGCAASRSAQASADAAALAARIAAALRAREVARFLPAP